MRDGEYVSMLNVDGLSAIGSMSLNGNDGRGSDGRFQYEVHLSGDGHAMDGILNVLLDASVAQARDIPAHFSLRMIGSGGDQDFNLIGTGPNGILIEIEAGWRAP